MQKQRLLQRQQPPSPEDTLMLAQKPSASDLTDPLPLMIFRPETGKGASRSQQQTAIHLSRVIGNQALQRVLAAPTLQRSFWDDVTETVDSATDWLSADAGNQPSSDWGTVDSPMSDPQVTDETLQDGNEPAFEGVIDGAPQQSSDMDAPHESDGDWWFDSFFSDNNSSEEGFQQSDTNANAPLPEALANSDCQAIEQEIQHIDDVMRELRDLSISMHPELTAAKASAESLEKHSPGSPQAVEARQRYEALMREYDEVVEQWNQAADYRDALQAQLNSCEADEKKKMPKDFPCC